MFQPKESENSPPPRLDWVERNLASWTLRWMAQTSSLRGVMSPNSVGYINKTSFLLSIPDSDDGRCRSSVTRQMRHQVRVACSRLSTRVDCVFLRQVKREVQIIVQSADALHVGSWRASINSARCRRHESLTVPGRKVYIQWMSNQRRERERGETRAHSNGKRETPHTHLSVGRRTRLPAKEKIWNVPAGI